MCTNLWIVDRQRELVGGHESLDLVAVGIRRKSEDDIEVRTLLRVLNLLHHFVFEGQHLTFEVDDEDFFRIHFDGVKVKYSIMWTFNQSGKV